MSSTREVRDWSVSQSERDGVGRGTYFLVAGTEEPALILASPALVEDVTHFLWVGVERQGRTHEGRRDGSLKWMPCSAPVLCTIVRSSTSENERLDICRGARQ